MTVPANKYVINNAANRSMDAIHINDVPKPKSILKKRGSQSSVLDAKQSPPESFRQKSSSASDLLDTSRQNGTVPRQTGRQTGRMTGTFPRVAAPRTGPPPGAPPQVPNGDVPASHQRPPVAASRNQ